MLTEKEIELSTQADLFYPVSIINHKYQINISKTAFRMKNTLVGHHYNVDLNKSAINKWNEGILIKIQEHRSERNRT